MKKGALAQKQEDFRALLLVIDQQIQTIQINSFRIHDEDLESIKEDLVLAAAQKLAETVKTARRLQGELGGR
jgi:hypothetical protein